MVLPPHQLAGNAAHGHVGGHGLDVAHGLAVGLLVVSKLDLQLIKQLVNVWNGKPEPLVHD